MAKRRVVPIIVNIQTYFKTIFTEFFSEKFLSIKILILTKNTINKVKKNVNKLK